MVRVSCEQQRYASISRVVFVATPVWCGEFFFTRERSQRPVRVWKVKVRAPTTGTVHGAKEGKPQNEKTMIMLCQPAQLYRFGVSRTLYCVGWQRHHHDLSTCAKSLSA